MMRRIRMTAVAFVAAAVAIAPWLENPAGAQQDPRRSRGVSRSAAQRGSSSFAPAAAPTSAAPRTVPKKPADTRNARLVHVEVLFVEITSADASKAKGPKLSGKTADVEKALAELKLHGQLKTLRRIKMSVLHGRKSMTQIGETKAIVSGVMAGGAFGGGRGGRGGGGGLSRSYRMQNFGTLLSLTPSAEPAGGVVLELSFEQSGTQFEDDSPKEPGETTAPAGTRTITFQNTLRVTAGEFATVTSSTFQAKKGTTQILVLATARADAKPVTTSNQTATRLTVIPLKHATAIGAAAVIDEILNKSAATIIPRVTADPRTNSLIVSGVDRTSLETVHALVRVLDVPVKSAK